MRSAAVTWTKHWKPLHGSPWHIARATSLADCGRSSGQRPVAADRARSTLSAMFAWAIGEGLVEVNPVNGTNKVERNKSRERVLSDAELAAIWKAAPDNDYGRIVKLLMLTAQRREEIGGLAMV